MQIGVLTAKLTLDNSDFKQGADESAQSAKNLSGELTGLSSALKGLGIGIIGKELMDFAGGAMVAAIKAASDMNESLSKSQVVFGESAKAIEDWSKAAATAMGLSQQAALESAATFGNLFTAMGLAQPAAAKMSTNLVQLAADLASFNNQNPEEMLMKLRSGLVGEIEPLRSVGVQMNEATVQAKAMEMGFGKTKAEISEGEKVLARYAIILDQTKTAQGDFGRTSDGVANQLRIMKAQTDDLLASFGSGLLPAVSGGLKVFNDLLLILTNMPDQFKNMAVAVVGVTAAVGASMVVIGGLVALLGGPLTLAIVAVVGVVATMTAAIAMEWKSISAIFGKGSADVGITLKGIAGFIGGLLDTFHIWAQKTIMFFDMVVSAGKAMAAALISVFLTLKDSIMVVIVGFATKDLGTIIAGFNNLKSGTLDAINGIGSAMGQWSTRAQANVAEISASMNHQYRDAFIKAAETTSSAVAKINTDLTGLADGMKNTANAAKAHGKAHEDAAAKAAKAWTIAKLQMNEDLARIAEMHQKTGEKILADKLATDQNWLKGNLQWGIVALKDLQKMSKDQLEQEVALGKQRLAVAVATTALLEAAEHTYAKNVIDSIKKAGEELKDIAQRDWGEGLGQMVLAVGQMAGTTTKELAKWSGDVSGIIHSMPGKFGDAARGILKTVDDWATFANRILKTLHDLNSKIPGSLSGLISSAVGIFKTMVDKIKGVFGGGGGGANATVEAALDSFFGKATKSIETGGAKAMDAATKAAGAITGILGGIGTFMGTRHQGLAAGVLGGAASGAQMGAGIGMLFGPAGAGIGAGIGAIGGAIAGLFGHGKSAAQKAEEERQKKQMQMDMEKEAIDITSTAIDTMSKALEMFKNLADHVDVPRAAIKSFFATLEKVTHEFLSLAGKFAKDNMDAAKTFAESMGPVVDLMGGALQAFEGLRFYTAIPAQAIKDLADDIGKAAELMGALAADIEANVVKKAMKFSKQMQFVVEMIGTAVESFVKLQDYKGVASYIMGWFFQDLQTATDMMGKIADDTSRNMLNKAKVYAEKIDVIVQTIGNAVTSLTSLRTYEAVPQAAFDALQHDIIAALSMIDGLVSAAELYLDKALTFEELVKRIVGALDSGVSLIRSVGGSAISGGVTVTPGDTSSIRSDTGARGMTGGGGLTIGSLSFPGSDPRTQRAVSAIEDLLGSGGFPLAAKAY